VKVSGISSPFGGLSRSSGQVSHVLLTRSPLDLPEQAPWASFDLHVLSVPPAFVLSQDQTLRQDLASSTARSEDRLVVDDSINWLSGTGLTDRRLLASISLNLWSWVDQIRNSKMTGANVSRAATLAEARATARTHTSFLSSVFKELCRQAHPVRGAGRCCRSGQASEAMTRMQTPFQRRVRCRDTSLGGAAGAVAGADSSVAPFRPLRPCGAKDQGSATVGDRQLHTGSFSRSTTA
jgi:hypothetical protein